ncbi:hypothetical protein HPB50_019324 [Hyalomma asiaticum]|uniref:Uncharacterized protein n=1 Tax=Hyalomma asiaticum TaxID=266040 RepID=A0ACB7RS42_HYAAI|nr:hypothetical protein HPB50_019324 [Hyalomma asiaticum]
MSNDLASEVGYEPTTAFVGQIVKTGRLQPGSSTSLTEKTPPRAVSPSASQPYQASSNQKLSVEAKEVVHTAFSRK